jgi:hypothetical protein
MVHAGSTEARTRWRWFAALVILTGLFAIVREVGVGYQLPTSGLADERVYIEHAEAFQSGVENTAALPGAATYPYLVSKLALATWRAPDCTSPDVADHLAAASSLAIRMRRVVAYLSLLAIPGMWLLVRAFSSRATAFVAAALCGASLFAQMFAQQGRPHGAMFGASVLALGLSVQLQRRTTFPLALLAGAAAGLSVAALQSGIALLAPVVVAVLLARGMGLGRRCALLAAAVLPACVAFRWAYAYLFVEHIDRGVQKGHALLGEGTFGLDMLDGSGFGTMTSALWTYDPILLAAALVGAAVAIGLALRALWSRSRDATDAPSSSSGPALFLDPRKWGDGARSAAVVCSYVVPYVVLFGLYRQTYARYALPLVPFLAWGAAWLMTPRGRWVRTWFAWIPAALVVCTQTFLVAKLAYVRARPDTLDEAAQWIERETPRDAAIGVFANDDLPLLRLPEQRAELRPLFARDPNRHWLAYQARLGPGPWDAHARPLVTPRNVPPDELIDAFLAAGADYCLVRTHQYYQPKGFEALHRDLLERAKLAATFWPVDEARPGPFTTREEYQVPPSFSPWIVRLAHARTTGNLVEVWDLRSAR